MAELIIRRAEEKDLEAIEQLEIQCFTDPWSYESLRFDILENKRALYLVAELEGTVCGYMGLWDIVAEGHITNVAVSPEHRRKHIGSAMLDVMIDVCKEAGIEQMTLEVRAGNEPAKALYQSKGFKEAGLRKGYYQDNGEDAIIMWRE